VCLCVHVCVKKVVGRIRIGWLSLQRNGGGV